MEVQAILPRTKYTTLDTAKAPDQHPRSIPGLASENISGRIENFTHDPTPIRDSRKSPPSLHSALRRDDQLLLQIALNPQLTLLELPVITTMCPSCNGDVPPATDGQVNGHGHHTPHNPRRQPFASVGDYLSNVSNFKIIESTLREGEQVRKDLRF